MMTDAITVPTEEKTDSGLRQQEISRRVAGLRGLAGVLALAISDGSSATLDEQEALWLLHDGLKQLDLEINP